MNKTNKDKMIKNSKKKAKHPTQPLYLDCKGIIRFKSNKIVEAMLELGRQGTKFDLNSLAVMNLPDEDWVQFSQLIGYSLSGFGDLSYVSDKVWKRVAKQKVKQI